MAEKKKMQAIKVPTERGTSTRMPAYEYQQPTNGIGSSVSSKSAGAKPIDALKNFQIRS